jgi:cell division protein FtsB
VTDGHRTSTIARPRQPEHQAKDATRTSADGTKSRSGILDDFTTPIPLDKRLVRRRTNRLALSTFAVLIVAALVAAVFVLPVQSWMRQNDQLKDRKGDLATLNATNDQIQAENDRLQTNDGIKEAARDEIDYVDEGEKRISVTAVGAAPAVLPAGWPYDQITRIVELRRAAAAAAVAAPVVVSP